MSSLSTRAVTLPFLPWEPSNFLTLANAYMDQAAAHPDDLAARAKAEKYAKILSKTSFRDRPALNRDSTSKGGMVPNSSQNSTTRFFSLPPFSSATENSSRLRFD